MNSSTYTKTTNVYRNLLNNLLMENNIKIKILFYGSETYYCATEVFEYLYRPKLLKQEIIKDLIEKIDEIYKFTIKQLQNKFKTYYSKDDKTQIFIKSLNEIEKKNIYISLHGLLTLAYFNHLNVNTNQLFKNFITNTLSPAIRKQKNIERRHGLTKVSIFEKKKIIYIITNNEHSSKTMFNIKITDKTIFYKILLNDKIKCVYFKEIYDVNILEAFHRKMNLWAFIANNGDILYKMHIVNLISYLEFLIEKQEELHEIYIKSCYKFLLNNKI